MGGFIAPVTKDLRNETFLVPFIPFAFLQVFNVAFRAPGVRPTVVLRWNVRVPSLDRTLDQVPTDVGRIGLPVGPALDFGVVRHEF